MNEDKDNKKEDKARKTLEAWLKNCNLWCMDSAETGWQSHRAQK